MYEGAIQDLIDELGRLPGIGPKSAQRIAFHLLSADPTDVHRLAAALTRVKELVRFCTTCFNVAASAVALPDGKRKPRSSATSSVSSGMSLTATSVPTLSNKSTNRKTNRISSSAMPKPWPPIPSAACSC